MAHVAAQFGALLGADDADMEIHVGQQPQVFHAHTFILKVRSPYFRAMLASGMLESKSQIVKMPAVSGHIFEMMLPFVYGGRVAASVESFADIQCLADLADFMQLGDFPQYMRETWDVQGLLEKRMEELSKEANATKTEKWLATMAKQLTLHKDLESMLVKTAQNETAQGKLPMLCRANLHGMPTLKKKCVDALNEYVRNNWTMANAGTAASALEMEFQYSDSFCMGSPLHEVYADSMAEGLAAILRSAAECIAEAQYSPQLVVNHIVGPLLHSVSVCLAKIPAMSHQHRASSTQEEGPASSDEEPASLETSVVAGKW